VLAGRAESVGTLLLTEKEHLLPLCVEDFELAEVNFGTGNWAWKDCLQRSTIAVMDDVRVHPFWQRGDREGYIAEAMRVLQSKSGARPIRGVSVDRWPS
jgi:hypothetical protein